MVMMMMMMIMMMLMTMLLIKMMMIMKTIVGILINNRMDLNVSYGLNLDWITLIRIIVMMTMAGVLVIIKMTIDGVNLHRQCSGIAFSPDQCSSVTNEACMKYSRI